MKGILSVTYNFRYFPQENLTTFLILGNALIIITPGKAVRNKSKIIGPQVCVLPTTIARGASSHLDFKKLVFFHHPPSPSSLIVYTLTLTFMSVRKNCTHIISSLYIIQKSETLYCQSLLIDSVSNFFEDWQNVMFLWDSWLAQGAAGQEGRTKASLGYFLGLVNYLELYLSSG